MSKPRDQDLALDERLADVDPELIEYAIGRDIVRRRAIRANLRSQAKSKKVERRKNRPKPDAMRNRYRKLRNGERVIMKRPLAKVEDRRYVPAALRHWRLTHDLTPEQAGARVGLSPRSCSWRHYEDGYMAPPYLMLLKIIAATGLGTNLERKGIGEPAPELLLERVHAEMMATRRPRRRPLRPKAPAPTP
jgi:ribosomal protein L21